MCSHPTPVSERSHSGTFNAFESIDTEYRNRSLQANLPASNSIPDSLTVDGRRVIGWVQFSWSNMYQMGLFINTVSRQHHQNVHHEQLNMSKCHQMVFNCY